MEKFSKVISDYLTEADDPSAGAAADPTAGGDPMAGGGGGDPMAGGDPMGGAGGGDPMAGGMGGDPMGGDDQMGGGDGASSTASDICSEKYVRIVSYLCELYNTNASSKPKMVLNLKVKVGETYNLNDINNAKTVFTFMIDHFLNQDVKDEVEKSVESAKEAIAKIKNEGKLAENTPHNATSPFLIDAATSAYTAICNSALGETLPEINYGITKEYRVDPKNAKAVFDEIKKNTDQLQKLSEVDR